jgi:teichuronic acid exporter
LMLIYGSAIPRAFGEAASSLLQAVDQSRVNLLWNLGFTLLFSVALLLAVPQGVVAVAIAVLLVHLTVLPVFTLWAKRHVLQLVLAAGES